MSFARRDADMRSRYLPAGPLMTAAETARALGFPSTEALAKARLAGRLPFKMFKIPGRRGWFASTDSVEVWLAGMLEGISHPEGPP